METLRHNISQQLNLSGSKQAEKQLAEYQKNMKVFIQSVEKQIASIIDKYQTQIKSLKKQNQRLKKQLNGKGMASTGLDFGRGFQMNNSEYFSPIKDKRVHALLGEETVKSRFLQQIPLKNFFEQDHHNFFGFTKPNFIEDFSLSNSPQRLNKSKFQIENNKKKQRQSDLIHSLQLGKTNIQQNTDKMFSLIGKSKQLSKKQNQYKNQQERQQQFTNKNKKQNEELNTSLNSICDSLNNSFHAKRAHQKNARKRKQQKSKQLQNMKKQQQREKIKKQQGIKNLLRTMRKNISHQLEKPQIVKGSKLLTTGQNGKNIQLSTKSRVLINPVPVDLSQINRHKQHNQTTNSPIKNVRSILKNSSNILTKSIENISAISFYSSGGDY